MTASNSLQGPYQSAASGTTRQAVILLHGYGSDGQDLLGLAPYFAQALPDAAFYAPHGPQACEMTPFGRQWFSLDQYDPDLLRRHPDTLGPALECLAPGVKAAAPSVQAMLETVCAREGLTPDKVALVGFSQGTMVALHVALCLQVPRLAGVIGFSGALVGAATLAQNVIPDPPPVLLIHGDLDPVLPFAAMDLTETALTAAGVPNDTLQRPGLEHAIDEAGIARAMDFLRLIFALS